MNINLDVHRKLLERAALWMKTQLSNSNESHESYALFGSKSAQIRSLFLKLVLVNSTASMSSSNFNQFIVISVISRSF